MRNCWGMGIRFSEVMSRIAPPIYFSPVPPPVPGTGTGFGHRPLTLAGLSAASCGPRGPLPCGCRRPARSRLSSGSAGGPHPRHRPTDVGRTAACAALSMPGPPALRASGGRGFPPPKPDRTLGALSGAERPFIPVSAPPHLTRRRVRQARAQARSCPFGVLMAQP